MKNIISPVLGIVVGLATLNSCSDYLDADNKSAGTLADEYFSTDDGIEAARVTAFNALYAVGSNYAMYCAGTDIYQAAGGNTTYQEFDCYYLTDDDTDVRSFYVNCYSLEQYANFYIETAGEGTDGEAEGIFLRAYAYYLLTQQFGGVPYIGYYVTDVTRNFPKASLDSIYSIMEEQLEDVYNSGLLPSTSSDGSISNQAVACLLAKFYLADAWDNDTELTDASNGTYSVSSTSKFSTAASWAEKAIDGAELTQTFADKWSPFNEPNEEQLWSIQYDRSSYPGDITEGGHGMQSMFGSYYNAPENGGQKAVNHNGVQNLKSAYLWDEGDVRYEETFMLKMYNWDGDEDHWSTIGYFGYYNNGDPDTLRIAYQYYPYWWTDEEIEADFAEHASQYVNPVLVSTSAYKVASPVTRYEFDTEGNWSRSYMTFDAFNAMTSSGSTVKKFDDADTQQLNSQTIDYRDIVVFDLSDMMLTAAEAYLLCGDNSDALAYVNEIRERAGASTLSSFDSYSPNYSYTRSLRPLDVILDERARELYGQQLRWMDLRRTRQLVRYNIEFNDEISSVSDMTGTDGNIKWLRPIPEDAISGNNSLTDEDQNPGY